MLSVANAPDPSCSSKAPALNSDEKGHPSKRPSSFPEADPADGPDEAQRPYFSIRDYAFSSRSKDVRTHWPFPQQYLRLCVKHGVRDLLPPFEPPDLVRARSLNGKHVPADHLSIVCPESEENQTEVSVAVKRGFSLPTQESVSGSSHQHHINPLSEDKTTVVRAAGSEDKLFRAEDGLEVIGHDHSRSIPSSAGLFPGSVELTRSTASESSSGVEVAKPPRLAENFGGTSERSIKKCRLIVKFGGSPESNRTEDTVSSLSSVSDRMASKACPVCKTFTSTSNTTLNAHIDQCLSVESSAKRDAMKLSQHKVKPRKKRSMEEICATAPRCTLEDLDRRNGTNWALDFSSIRQNNDALRTTERKQPRISPLKAADDEREGAVYVDSNGTKLLILSKFNDAQSTTAVDCYVPTKCKKEFKNKSPPFGKGKCLPQKYRKYLKAKLQRKKISSFSCIKGEVHKERELHSGTLQEDRMISQASNAPEQVKVSKPGTLGHWICSKRSSLLKHLNSRSGHRKSRNPLAITNHTSMESDQSASCDYFAKECVQKCCKSSDEILSPPKGKSTDVPSDVALASLDQGNNSADLLAKNARSIGNNPSISNSIMLKLFRSTGKCVSSAKAKRVEMHTDSVRKSGKFQSMRKNYVGCHSKVYRGEKGSRKSVLMDGQQCRKEASKCDELVQGVVSKKLWKHQFVEKPHKAMKELSLELAEGFHGSPDAHSLGSISNNVTSGVHQSNFSENVMRPETSNTLEPVTTHQDKTVDSNQDDACYHTSEEGEHDTLNHSQVEAEWHHAEVTEFDLQFEVPASMESMVKYPMEKSIGTCSSKVVTSEDHEATTCDRLGFCLSLEDERQHCCANEATIAESLPKLLGDQGMHYDVIASDDVCQDFWQVGQIESRLKNGCSSELQNMAYQADIASIQGSSASLSRPEDKALELSTSATSGRTVAVEICNMIVEGEPSGSPVSAASTISHLSVEDLKSKDAEQEPSEETVVIQENLRPHHRNLRLLVDDSIRVTDRTDPDNTFQRLKATTSTQDPEGLWDGQPCCCSGRESIPHKYRIFRQSAMVGMMLPTKTKHITSSLYIRPAISSSGTYSHSKSEVKSIPILDSPTNSSSVKASSNFAEEFSPFGRFGSASSSSHIQPQSTSSPILRLMGKNLMVSNKRERSVQEQNQTVPCSSEDTSNGKYMSLLGFSSTCNFSNLDGIQYHPPQSRECSMLTGQHPSNIQAPVPLPAKPMGSFAGTLLQSSVVMKTDSYADHNWLDKKPNSSIMYSSEMVCTPHGQTLIPVTRCTIPERDINVIDDSSKHENGASGSMQNLPSNMAPPFSGSDFRRSRSFSGYPSLNLVQPRELGCDLKPGFPIPCLRNTTSTKWGSTSGSSGLPLPRQVVVPSHSAGQESTTLYHSPDFK